MGALTQGVAALGATACAICAQRGAAVDLTAVMLTGDTGPLGLNVEADAVFAGFFGQPIVDASGNIYFYGLATGVNVPFNTEDGVWMWNGGPNNALIRKSDPSPFDLAPIDSVGLFTAGNDSVVAVSSVEAIAVESGVPFSLSHTSDTPPGVGAEVFYGEPYFGPAVASATGHYAFKNHLTGAVTLSDDIAVFAGSAGALNLLAREGEVGPTGDT